MHKYATIAISAKGARIACLIAEQLDASVFVLDKYCMEEAQAFEKLSDTVKELFPLYKGLIFIMAQGIASRVTAPLLTSKYSDPAIVVCDDAGRFVISALSGHEGGANTLAYAVAGVTGATPVITTASEANKLYVAGIGARKGITAEEVIQALQQACEKSEITLQDLRLIASAWIKSHEDGLLQAAEKLNLPIRFLPEFLYSTHACKPTAAAKYFNILAVAEPSAMIAGHNPELIFPTTAFGAVTVAISRDTLMDTGT